MQRKVKVLALCFSMEKPQKSRFVYHDNNLLFKMPSPSPKKASTKIRRATKTSPYFKKKPASIRMGDDRSPFKKTGKTYYFLSPLLQYI